MQRLICKWPLGTSLLAYYFRSNILCEREAEPGKEYCIFHLPNKTPEQAERFKYALKRVIEKQLEDKEANMLNFIGFYFPSTSEVIEFLPLTLVDRTPTISTNLNFLGATFSGNVNIFRIKFSGDVRFFDAMFSDDTRFLGTTFSGNAYFDDATFSGDASFSGATFLDDARFSDAMFLDDASFSRAKFSGNADFMRATFSEDANFFGATFSSNASFSSATFKQHIDFTECRFIFRYNEQTIKVPKWLRDLNEIVFPKNLYVDMRSVTFEQPEKVVFDYVNLTRVLLMHTKIDKVSFRNIDWRNEDGEQYKVYGSSLLLQKELIGKTKSTGSGRETDSHPLLEDADLSLTNVLQVYRRLRDRYEDDMKYDDAGKFFISEMDLRSRSTQTRLSERVFLWMYKALRSYGEDIVTPFSLIVLTIFLVAYYRFLASFTVLRSKGSEIRCAAQISLDL